MEPSQQWVAIAYTTPGTWVDFLPTPRQVVERYLAGILAPTIWDHIGNEGLEFAYENAEAWRLHPRRHANPHMIDHLVKLGHKRIDAEATAGWDAVAIEVLLSASNAVHLKFISEL